MQWIKYQFIVNFRCQDIFVRKTNLEKNIYRSTHLVCPTPEGNKYNAAVKWKLPAVTAEWLKTCAAELKRVDETPFLVGETIGIQISKNWERLLSEKTRYSVRGITTI